MSEFNLPSTMDPESIVITTQKGFGSTLGALVVGGTIGALGAYSYGKKRYSKEKNVELLLMWMMKNVYVNISQEELGLGIGPIRLHIEKPNGPTKQDKKTPFTDQRHSENIVDDNDIVF